MIGYLEKYFRRENIVGKGENAGYQHFLLFPTMFSKSSYFRVVRSQDCVIKGCTQLKLRLKKLDSLKSLSSL